MRTSFPDSAIVRKVSKVSKVSKVRISSLPNGRVLVCPSRQKVSVDICGNLCIRGLYMDIPAEDKNIRRTMEIFQGCIGIFVEEYFMRGGNITVSENNPDKSYRIRKVLPAAYAVQWRALYRMVESMAPFSTIW